MPRDRSGDFRSGPRIGHDDREVALDIRMARWRPGAWIDQASAGQSGDRDFADDDALGPQLQHVQHRRVQFADPSGDRAVAADEGRSARMQVRIVLDRVYAGRANPRRAAMSSTRPFASSRSKARATRFHDLASALPVSAKPRRHHSWSRRPVDGRAIALADLEDRDIVTAMAQVGRHDLQEAPEQALAHDRMQPREWVRHDDRCPAWRLVRFACRRAIVPPREPLDHRRRHEGERDGLGHARAGQRRADRIADLERLGRKCGIGVCGRVDGTRS